MFKRSYLLLIALAASFASFADGIDDAMPERAAGNFVQRKTLGDVGVTLTSNGRYEFAKGKYFVWHTLEPLESTFVATPTNYSITVNGKTTTQRLKNDVRSIAKIFEIKEVKEFVKEVKSTPEAGFPRNLTVDFKNGDKLEIDFRQQ